ncbi:MAG TPA: replicative DNA helicase [Fimbriimonadales bacterium]|nr:replicative DNA helicase [Fimbriimonadales bacterium]
MPEFKATRTPASSKAVVSTTLKDAVPPHNDEAEAAALGSMLLSPEMADRVISILNENDFYNPIHREIFKAMLAVNKSLRQIDVVTVLAELTARGILEQIGGQEILVQIAETVPSASNAEYYAQIVKDLAILRGLQNAAHEIISLIHDPETDIQEKIDQSERRIFEVTQRTVRKDFSSLADATAEYFKDIDRIYETNEPIRGLHTGFKSLDKKLTGLYPGNLVILAARPGVGKTSLALNIAMSIAEKEERTVALFTMEMSEREIVRRILCTTARVDSQIMSYSGHLDDEHYNKLVTACERLYPLRLYIDDTSDLSPFELRAKCRRLKAETGDLGLVVVDYLQLMRPPFKTENRVQQITDIARSLKIFAKELDTPILALSQLTRAPEKRRNKRPLLSDLRESGSIEADADVVLLLYREDLYSRDPENEEDGEEEVLPPPPPEPQDPFRVVPVEVEIAKNRNGPTGRITFHFQPVFTLFTERAREV